MAKNFTFEISLSVLNHLGRNLYRSFVTVLGEAISNSWDANSDNVKIYINKKNNSFIIIDDGDGMSEEDFQNKFLKIGYSKRKAGESKSSTGRPYIGRKGIGKLALLSCAEKVTVISKKIDGEYVGGLIDNSGLDKAIKDDVTPDEYILSEINLSDFSEFTKDHKKGTIIYFENIKDGIKNSLKFLKKVLALYFRFSLLDKKFNIFLNDEVVSIDDLKDLAKKTEFLWNINDFQDPFIEKEFNESISHSYKEQESISIDYPVKGFIASVLKPRDLTIINMEERVSIDLFVNGRLREKDILRHMPSSRVVENYLYGQIHFDDLDDEKDRFASSREGIIADDPRYREFLDVLKAKVIDLIINQWDKWRRENREQGDSENEKIPLKERKAEELFNEVSKDYEISKDSPNKSRVNEWVKELSEEAKYNFPSYAECFTAENLIRKFIEEEKKEITPEAVKEFEHRQKRESENKKKGNISIDIRKNNSDLSYLSMDHLANLVDKKNPLKEACLSRDALEYKPPRDALAHTSLLTDQAKTKLNSTFENIKARLVKLLSGEA